MVVVGKVSVASDWLHDYSASGTVIGTVSPFGPWLLTNPLSLAPQPLSLVRPTLDQESSTVYIHRGLQRGDEGSPVATRHLTLEKASNRPCVIMVGL